MSNKTDYEAMLPSIEAIAKENVQTPRIPMDHYLQEAENLSHWCKLDASQLNTVGISDSMIAELPVRCGACREAQSRWCNENLGQQEAQKEWKEKKETGFNLRNELLHTLRYAFRKQDELISQISQIAEGDTNADMIQDLNDIAVLGKANEDKLTAIAFDLTRLDEAAQMSTDLAELLAIANGDKAVSSETKVIRDRAFTHLKELVDEIRAAGKYLFWRDRDRYKGYVSVYWRIHQSKTKDNDLIESQA